MTQRHFLLFIALSLVVLIFTFVQKERSKEAYLQAKSDLVLFEQNAKEMGDLKRKFDDKKGVEKFIKSATSIQAPSKTMRKGDVEIVEFDGLDANRLNRLIKRVQNDTVELKKIEIKRSGEASASVRLEIQK